MRLRTMPHRTISITQAMSVARNARSDVMAMRIVPERWYEAPQIPNRTERPERPAAIGCRISVSVSRCKEVVFSREVLRVT